MGKRLIDAEALKAHYSWWAGGSDDFKYFKEVFDTIVDLQPTVAVVEPDDEDDING